MKPTRFRNTLAALIALALVSAALTAAWAALKKGDKAPDFKLPSIQGKTLSLSQIRKDPGKKTATRAVLIDFWATWCGPCRDEIPHLEKLHQKYGKKGLAVVGVALDKAGAEVVKPFAEKHKMTYILLLDPNGSAKKTYAVRYLPTAYIIDKNGVIRSVHVGFAPGVEKALEAEIQSLLK